MFKKFIKPLLIAGCSLFIIAGCQSNSTTSNATTTKETVTLDGKWEAVDFRSTIERSLGYQDFQEDRALRLIFIDQMKDLKPTLNISGNDVEFEYNVSLKEGFSRFYDYLKEYGKKMTVSGSKEDYLKTSFGKVKDDLKYLKHTKFDYDDNELAVHGVLSGGKIDTTAKTIAFPETPNIVGLAVVSINKSVLKVTYNYTLEGDVLTLTLEQKDERNKVTANFKMQFKKVQDATSSSK